MKSTFKLLSFIGTALAIVTTAGTAFAQSNIYGGVCEYTPQNKFCLSSPEDDMMTSGNMNQQNTNNQNRTTQPTNSSRNSDIQNRNEETGEFSPGRSSADDRIINVPGDNNQMTQPSNSNNNSNSSNQNDIPDSPNNVSPGRIAPGVNTK
jgi:signal peptidase I